MHQAQYVYNSKPASLLDFLHHIKLNPLIMQSDKWQLRPDILE